MRCSAKMHKCRTACLSRQPLLKQSAKAGKSGTDRTSTQATLPKIRSDRYQPKLHRRDLEHSHQRQGRHRPRILRDRSFKGLEIPHQRPEHHSQRLEHYYHKRLECHHHHESHLQSYPESRLLLRLGSHRMHRITKLPVRGPIQVLRRPSTARTPRNHRGQTPQPRTWNTLAPRGPFGVSKEENRAIKNLSKATRCNRLPEEPHS